MNRYTWQDAERDLAKQLKRKPTEKEIEKYYNFMNAK